MISKIKQQLDPFVNFILHSENDYLTYIALLEEPAKTSSDRLEGSGRQGGKLAKSKALAKGLPTTLGNKFGTKEDFLKYASWLAQNRPEYSLHMTLNKCKHSGRKAKDVIATRVFCLDLDREITESAYQILLKKAKPHLVVKSSERTLSKELKGEQEGGIPAALAGKTVAKYHFYWKIVSDSEFDLKHWSYIQAGLAAKFRGDSSLADITHLIRVPYFQRTTKSGELFTPQIVYLDPALKDNQLRSKGGFGEVSYAALKDTENFPAFGEDIINNGKAFLKEIKTKVSGQGDIIDKYFGNISFEDGVNSTNGLNGLGELSRITNANMHLIIDGTLWRNRSVFNAIKKATTDLLIRHPDIQSVSSGSEVSQQGEVVGSEGGSQDATTLNYLKFIKTNGLHRVLWQFASNLNHSFELSGKEPLEREELSICFKQGISYGVLQAIDFLQEQTAELDLIENMEGFNMEGNIVEGSGSNVLEFKPSGKLDGSDSGKTKAAKAVESDSDLTEGAELASLEGAIAKPSNDNIYGVSYHKHILAIQKEIIAEPKIKEALIKYFQIRKFKAKKEIWCLDYIQNLKPLYDVLALFALRSGPDKFKFLVKKDSDFAETSGQPTTFSYFESEVATKDQRQYLFSTIMLPVFKEILAEDSKQGVGAGTGGKKQKLGLKFKDFFDFCTMIAGKGFAGNIGHLGSEGGSQEPNRVVALNGVFSFENKLTFTECYVSPVKYPNIINAKFDVNLLNEFKDIIKTKFNNNLRYSTGKKIIHELAEKHCPLFLEACRDWFGQLDGEETAITLMAWYGYCFTTNTDFHKILYMYGASRAGKGTVARILDMLIGLGNHSSFDLKYFKEDSFVFSSSYRKLIIVAEEINTSKFSDHLDFLKKITGDCTYTYNKKFMQPVCEKVTSKVILVSNELGLPNVRDESEALLNRLVPVWFKHSFVGKEKRSLDRDIIKKEGSALTTLSSLMMALCLKSGKGIPVHSRAVKSAMHLVREQLGDKVWEYLDAHAEIGKDYFTPSTELYQAIYEYEQEMDEFSEGGGEFGIGEPSRADQMRYSKSIRSKFPDLDGSYLRKIDGKVVRGFSLKIKN